MELRRIASGLEPSKAQGLRNVGGLTVGLMLNSCRAWGNPTHYTIATLNTVAPASDFPTRFPFSPPVPEMTIETNKGEAVSGFQTNTLNQNTVIPAQAGTHAMSSHCGGSGLRRNDEVSGETRRTIPSARSVNHLETIASYNLKIVEIVCHCDAWACVFHAAIATRKGAEGTGDEDYCVCCGRAGGCAECTAGLALDNTATLQGIQGKVLVDQGQGFAPAAEASLLKPGDKIFIGIKGQRHSCFRAMRRGIEKTHRLYHHKAPPLAMPMTRLLNWAELSSRLPMPALLWLAARQRA